MLDVKFSAAPLQQTNGKEDEDTRLRELQISDKALGTLANALGLVDERIKDKGNKATDLAKIARDMSIIHKNMAPPQQLQGVNLGMQIIIQAPQQKQINDYEIMVSE